MIPFTATSVEKPFVTDFRLFVVGTFRTCHDFRVESAFGAKRRLRCVKLDLASFRWLDLA
jgi:hypothetical protein